MPYNHNTDSLKILEYDLFTLFIIKLCQKKKRRGIVFQKNKVYHHIYYTLLMVICLVIIPSSLMIISPSFTLSLLLLSNL